MASSNLKIEYYKSIIMEVVLTIHKIVDAFLVLSFMYLISIQFEGFSILEFVVGFILAAVGIYIYDKINWFNEDDPYSDDE